MSWFAIPTPKCGPGADCRHPAATDPELRWSRTVRDRSGGAVATAFARAGNADRARTIVRRYESEVADTARLRDDVPALHYALGYIAMADRKGREALVHFQGSMSQPDGPVDSCASCRYDAIGRAYALIGQRDSAIANIERYITTPSYDRIVHYEWDPAVLAPLYYELAGLHEQSPDPASKRSALAAYRQFITLWERADPKLQPRVQAAKTRIAELERVIG